MLITYVDAACCSYQSDPNYARQLLHIGRDGWSADHGTERDDARFRHGQDRRMNNFSMAHFPYCWPWSTVTDAAGGLCRRQSLRELLC